MASLQTLRNKGGIIVAIIIGLALIAFVLGDFLTSGSTLYSAKNSNVGEIDGNTIGQQEYASRLDYLTEIQEISSGGNTQQTDESSEALRNQAWESLIREYALTPALDKAGFSISIDEMAELISGKYVSPVILQMFSNPETGGFDREALNNFVKNLNADPSGRYQRFWGYLEKEVKDNAQVMKYKSIIDKGSYVTTFEAEKMAKLEGTNYSVMFVANQYSTIADSTVSVTEKEIKEFYSANPNMFKTGTIRTMEYVSFDALPSADDYQAAEKYINQLATEFRESDNVTQFASLNSQVPMDTRYYKEGEIAGELGTFAFSATAGEVYGPILESDQYVMARVASTKTMPDSVNFSHIVFFPTKKAAADSLAAELRKGGSFAEAATKFSEDKQSAGKGGEIGTLDIQTLPEQFSTPMLKSKKGDIIVVETAQSIHIVKINSIKGESKKVQLATIKYTIEPSENTRTQAYNDANAFAVAAANGFDKIATEKSLAKRKVSVGGNDRTVQGLPQSREMVRWAYSHEANNVSNVMEFGDSYVVATLKEIIEEGQAPLSEATDYIKTHLTELKKGQMLAEKMKGATSVEDLASKLALPVLSATEVNLTTFVVPEVGADPSFAGGICGMNPAKISKPIIGRSAVYVAQITETVQNPIAVEIEKARLNAENQKNAFNSAYQTIMELSKIKDTRYKFY